MTRKFDRPTDGNLSKPYQVVRYFDKFLTDLEGELGSLAEAQAAMAQALDAEHHADWSGVNNDNGHRPQDDATLGADWGVNLTSRPTELTDGRVAAGLNSSGDLNRNITTSRANSSNLLRNSGGGLYSGDLNATFGADLASNVSNVAPKYLPAITSANIQYKFTGAITYSATAGTPATATISVSAGSLLIGSTAVSYNAMSANVTGTNGTNVTYFLYVSSNGFNNGAHTLLTTTNGDDIYSGDSFVYIGNVTVAYPSSGSGSGGGYSGGGGGGPAGGQIP